VWQGVFFQVVAGYSHVLAVARLDVLEEALDEVGHGGVFCAGHFLLLFFFAGDSPIATWWAASFRFRRAFFSVSAECLSSISFSYFPFSR